MFSTFLSSFYRLLTDLGAPFITLYLWRRRARGREDVERFAERFGHASRPRPMGRLVWFHAASVGEAASLLLLIEKIYDLHPDINVLLTTGTVSAARVMMPRLPPHALHQYMPIDRMPCINRFLDHWQPILAVWIESELWPNTLTALRVRMVPTVLLNARISEKSFRNWHKVKSWAQQLLSAFNLCLVQTEDDRGRFVALGARPVKYLGNIKYSSRPLSCDEGELALLQKQSANRPLWAMVSTHSGEEEMAVATHRELARRKHPDLLTVLVPRHAVRGQQIAEMLALQGLRVARRSKGEAILRDTEIYLADTMGEMGLFYRLCSIVVLGGSFVRVGGHNPIEAAQLGAAIIFGPFMTNFSEIAREFLYAQAAVQLQHANEMVFAIERMLEHPIERNRRVQSARLLADQKRHILDHILVELEPWLKT